MGPDNATPISPAELAVMIQSDSTYKPGQVVELHSCSTGKGSNSFAQQLSNIMNTPVRAPDDLYWSHYSTNDGSFRRSTIGPTGNDNSGNWVNFSPIVNPSPK